MNTCPRCKANLYSSAGGSTSFLCGSEMSEEFEFREGVVCKDRQLAALQRQNQELRGVVGRTRNLMFLVLPLTAWVMELDFNEINDVSDLEGMYEPARICNKESANLITDIDRLEKGEKG